MTKATTRKAPAKLKKTVLKRTVASPTGGKGAKMPDIDPVFAPVFQAFLKAKDVVGGRMMSSYGLKVNGRIFVMYGRGLLTVKLPAKRCDELIAAGLGKRFDAGQGRQMREWVSVPSGIVDWVEIAKEAYRYVKNG